MNHPDSLLEPLTNRELEILSQLASDQSNQDIASSMNLSVNSVKWYARQIYRKLGVENRRKAISKATNLGLLKDSLPSDTGKKSTQPFPSGTVTFLFTDFDDPNPLREEMSREFLVSQAKDYAILRQVIEANGGQVFQMIGGAIQAVFRLASEGLYAAIAVQRALLQFVHMEPQGLTKVRIGLHTGPAEPDPSGFSPYLINQTITRTAKIMSGGYGGQILLSQEAAYLVDRNLLEGVKLKDLGEHHLKGIDRLEHLYQVVAADMPQLFPPLPSAIARTNNLPIQLTSFIGREVEIAEVSRLIEMKRLVTLHGSGGTGKTRLALQVCAGEIEHFSAGICLVELATLTDPETVPQTIAASLGLQRITDISYQDLLVNYLHEKHLLLVLDNCEHLLEVCPQLVDNLLRSCSQLTLLVTSREILGISGEIAYRVPSLSIPSSADLSPENLTKTEAVRLFTERAISVLPSFQTTDESLIATAHICRRLDGIPLAIELAAARVNVLTVEQIAARLDGAFRLLTSGSRTALPRQRTLRGSIDWSYSLLSEPDRWLLQRLSIFSGGWTLEAAEMVCAFDGLETKNILDGLSSLVNKSLILVDPMSTDRARYRMLETIRQYAQEKLQDAGHGDETHDRHLDYFTFLAEEYGPLLHTSRIVALLDQLDLEVDNLRGAIAWAIFKGNQEDLEKAIRILHPLLYFWFTRALVTEVVNWVDGILCHLSVSTSETIDLCAKALFLQGFLNTVYSLDSEMAVQKLRESVRLFRQANNLLGEGLASGLLHMALSQILSVEYHERFKDIRSTAEEEISQIHAESLAIANKLITRQDPESRWTAANILWWMDFYPPFADRQNNKERRNFLYQAGMIFTDLGDYLAEINLLTGLDYIGFSSPGENEPPFQYLTLDQGLELAQRLKSKFSMVWLTSQSGLVSYFQGNYQKMVGYFQSVRYLFQETGQMWGVCWSIRMIAVGYYYLEDIPQALILFRESLELYSNKLGDTGGINSCLIFLAGILALGDESIRAVKLLGFIERQYEEHYQNMGLVEKKAFGKIVATTKLNFNKDEFCSFWQQGRTMTPEDALTDARRIWNESG